MPIEENQVIAASVPVRLGLVCAIAGISVVHGKGMSKSGFWGDGRVGRCGWRCSDWIGDVAWKMGWHCSRCFNIKGQDPVSLVIFGV